MNKKKILIISFDAVDGSDLDFLCTLPNFSSIIKETSYSKEVETIYPSLTYPAHTSIVTGMKPINHGVINNIKIQPNRCNSSDWFWEQKEVKADSLFDVAKRNGLTCSSILWPVSCKSNIKYNMPEVFANRKWQNQILVSALNGNPIYQFKLNKKFAHLRNGVNQPELDNYTINCFLDTLKEYDADVMFLHLTDVDATRHKFGYDSKEAESALRRHDARLGEVLSTLKNLNIFDDTTLILLGDHSMMNTHSVIKLNNLLLNKNWLTLTKDNKNIGSWEVYLNTCDGAAYVYLKDKHNKALLNEVIDTLKKFSSENDDCIKEILTSKEAEKLGADTNCSLMLEAKKGYYFINDFTAPAIESTDEKHDKATHGYNPSQYDNGTFFMVKDKSVKKDFNIGPMKLIDEAPTISKIMGETLVNVDGRVLDKIFI